MVSGMGMSTSARALRAGHAVIAVVELGCLGYLWFCALTGRRDRLLRTAVTVLGARSAGHG